MTNYTLMHKNISVLSFSMDETTGTITHIESIYDEKHVPCLLYTSQPVLFSCTAIDGMHSDIPAATRFRDDFG